MVADAGYVRIGRKQVGRIDRPSSCQDEHDIEIGQGEDRRKQDDDRQDRTQQRNRDLPELVPGSGAVYVRRFVKMLRNGHQAGENGDYEEGQPSPYVHEYACVESQVGIAEPVVRPDPQRVKRPNIFQNPVYVAIGRIENQPPAQRRQRRWRDEWNKQRAAQEFLEPQCLQQKQGGSHSEHDLEDNGEKGEQQCVPYRYQENVVFGNNVFEIFYSDKLGLLTDKGIAQTEINRQAKRINHQSDHDEGGRHDEAVTVDVGTGHLPQRPEHGAGRRANQVMTGSFHRFHEQPPVAQAGRSGTKAGPAPSVGSNSPSICG